MKQFGCNQIHNCPFTVAFRRRFFPGSPRQPRSKKKKKEQPNLANPNQQQLDAGRRLPGSLRSFTLHSVITWPLGHLPAPSHTEGSTQKLSVINYQLPAELRISEGIGTTVIVSGHWDYTHCGVGKGGGARPTLATRS